MIIIIIIYFFLIKYYFYSTKIYIKLIKSDKKALLQNIFI